MTETNMDLSELLAKQDGGDFLRGVAEAVPQPIVEADGNGPIGAGRHIPRNPPRRQDRLGCRDHRCRSQERRAEREIVGLGLVPSEAETFWMDFLRGLKATGQRCRVHYDLSRTASEKAAQHQPHRALERRGRTPRRCRRHSPERGLDRPPRRRGAVRAKRRMADRQQIHAGRGFRQKSIERKQTPFPASKLPDHDLRASGKLHYIDGRDTIDGCDPRNKTPVTLFVGVPRPSPRYPWRPQSPQPRAEPARR